MTIPAKWRTSAGGALARRIKGGKHAARNVRAQGRVPAAEARDARMRYAAERRAACDAAARVINRDTIHSRTGATISQDDTNVY